MHARSTSARSSIFAFTTASSQLEAIAYDPPPPPPPEPAYATPAPPPPWLDASPSAARQLFDREGGSFSAAAGSGSDSDDSREPELISWIRKAAQIDDDDDDYPDLR